MQRITLQESKLELERSAYLIDTHIRRFMDTVGKILGLELTLFDYYFFVGACTMVYAAPHQAKRIFGVDPFSDEFITEHIKAATALLSIARSGHDEDRQAKAR